MYILIFLLFFKIINSFIPAPLSILSSTKKSIMTEFKLINKEYNHFIYFIHEFHHIIGSKILSDNYKNLCNTYITVPDTIFPKIFALYPETKNISFNKKNYCQYPYDSMELIILKIKMKLSGYAAEEAFKKRSILLKYFVKANSFVNTKSAFTLLKNSYFLKNNIKDISAVLIHDQEIDYCNPIITKYINDYKKITKNNKTILKVENQIKKLYSTISTTFLQLLFAIYEELIIEYSNQTHQEKFYKMIAKNPTLLAHEIFFFKDLKSLWESQELIRDMSNIKNYNEEEKSIIESIINKKIYPFEKIKELKKIHKNIFKINKITKKVHDYQELITKKIKSLFKIIT